MLPPLFLDVEPHHRVRIHTASLCYRSNGRLEVMDMCAAPGSKVRKRGTVIIVASFFLPHDTDGSNFGSASCSGHDDLDLSPFRTPSCK